MARKILKIIKKWHGTTPNITMAKEIIDETVANGMLPPLSLERDYDCECGCKGHCKMGNTFDVERWR